MQYVYILESCDGLHWYVGLTNNIDRRLLQHNAGQTAHTRKDGRQWRLKSYAAFASRKRAFAFERYLKSHAGRAFAKKRL